jgi:Helix-hairpin-helix motif
LIVAFDREVRRQDIHFLSFRVLILTPSTAIQGISAFCWCQMVGFMSGVNVKTRMNDDRTCEIQGFVMSNDDAQFVNGAVFRPFFITDGPPGFPRTGYRIQLEGDLIADRSGLGLDADHLPDWLPKRRSGDGTAGGLFESLFVLSSSLYRRVNINTASASELRTVPGIGPALAARIISARTTRPVLNEEELNAILGAGSRVTEEIRDRISFVDIPGVPFE